MRPLNLFAFPGNENPIPPEHPASATVKISFEESELRPMGRFPLVPGTHFQTDVWEQISAVTHHPGGEVRVRLRELQLSSLLQPEQSRAPADFLRVALYNRKLNEFSIGRFARSSSNNGPGAIRTSNCEFVFESRNGAGLAKTEIGFPEDWLADAELVVFRPRKLGRSEQTLHVENLFVADRELPVTRLVD